MGTRSRCGRGCSFSCGTLLPFAGEDDRGAAGASRAASVFVGVGRCRRSWSGCLLVLGGRQGTIAQITEGVVAAPGQHASNGDCRALAAAVPLARSPVVSVVRRGLARG